ncbi:hypothetical protein GCM10023263_74750 [Phytohabitans rumicis]
MALERVLCRAGPVATPDDVDEAVAADNLARVQAEHREDGLAPQTWHRVARVVDGHLDRTQKSHLHATVSPG